MAKDAADDIGYYLLIDTAHKDDLAGIRHWNNLKAGIDGSSMWVKDFDYAQINAAEVKCIPYKTVFYSKQGKLFLQGSLLPDRNIPSLLWTPIDRALPVRLPSFNHNYFGVNSKIDIRLVLGGHEEEATAMIVAIDVLRGYIETAPAVRLGRLQWAILNHDKALLMGAPLLPLDGVAYWQRKDMFLPAGYDIDLYSLSDMVHTTVDPECNAYLFWNIDNTYFLVEKEQMQQLSLGSFRKSTAQLPAL